MTSDIREHLPHYLVLSGILTVGLISFTFFQYNLYHQQFAVIATAMGYFLWGIFHHLSIKDLSGKIVLEYLLIASLISVIMLAIMQQA